MFTDYTRPSIRLSALMKIPSLWVFTRQHLRRRDGPTHQPVEHLGRCARSQPARTAAVRRRPGHDRGRVGARGRAWDGPTLIALSRQNTAVLNRPATFKCCRTCSRGAYVLLESSEGRVTIVATGSGSASRSRRPQNERRRHPDARGEHAVRRSSCNRTKRRVTRCCRPDAARVGRSRHDGRLAPDRRRERPNTSGSTATANPFPRRSSRSISGSRARRSRSCP